MDAADVFLMYCAIKAHFSRDKYDYHKFGGKTKTKSNQVPFIYWAKFVTLQGNLVNAPFAVGLVNKFLAVDWFFDSLCFAACFSF